MEIAVTHNLAQSRFEAEIEGKLAHCDYEVADDRMVVTHTFVPPELRGRGLAEQLVRSTLALARSNRLKVVPACSYVDAFMKRHAEFQDLRADPGQ